MEPKSGIDQHPASNGDTTNPDTSGSAEKNQTQARSELTTPQPAEGKKATIEMDDNDKLLMSAKAFTESVQEEIKGENDALFLKSYSSDIKKKTSLNKQVVPAEEKHQLLNS